VIIVDLKKVWGSLCGAKEKYGGQHKCISCMAIVRYFEEYIAKINPIKSNIGLKISLNMT